VSAAEGAGGPGPQAAVVVINRSLLTTIVY
jgi:hypothetical protein